ncbi:NtrZ family periplasmic regulatory protein [Phenylobacterium aquaticum]|uniref:NtrZ family periplasmic regulatory protein n=1 Tax=Phenylobacterium aquaticum TaxID=1763816 RepID=UPI0026EE8191|nr:hypothetical protein [Phenylobacterium aquaticum]
MSNRTVISLMGAALLVGVASSAHAETAKKITDFTVRSDASTLAPQGTKSLKWDARKGRWGVTLNLDQPVGRDAQWNDVQAGAYFRVTPSLRIGGAVALGDKITPAYNQTQPQESAPRVKLETAFKF